MSFSALRKCDPIIYDPPLKYDEAYRTGKDFGVFMKVNDKYNSGNYQRRCQVHVGVWRLAVCYFVFANFKLFSFIFFFYLIWKSFFGVLYVTSRISLIDIRRKSHFLLFF